MTPSISEVVRKHLWAKMTEDGLTPKDIAEQIDCSAQWVRAFLAHEIKNPGVDTIAKLFEVLNGEPLLTQARIDKIGKMIAQGEAHA